MEIDRREVLVASGVLGAMLATSARASPPSPAPPGLLEVLRIHVGVDGKSRADRVKVYGARKPIPAVSVEASSIGPGDGRWGNVPTKRFTINAVGELESELGDGTKVRIGKGDLVFIEDLTGSGHFTRFLSAVANLYIVVPDDFDLVAWAGDPPRD